MDEFLKPGSTFNRLYDEYKKYGGLVIGVDYDGTLFDYHKKGTTYDMVIELVKDLKLFGCKIIIWTANASLSNVEKYLVEKGIPFDGINTDGVELGYTSRKPMFNCLIDDRAGILQTYTELKMLVDLLRKEVETPDEVRFGPGD